MSGLAHRIGAVGYVLWGLLHVVGGSLIMVTARSDGPAALALFGTGVAPEEIPPATSPVTEAVLAFHGWNIMWAGLLVTVVAVVLNWRNSRSGFWFNMAVVAGADLGLIWTMLASGVMRPADGAPGLVLFAIALIFSFIGLRRTRRQVVGTDPQPSTV